MPPRSRPARAFLSALGPGIVSGAADDDPSGIATYSVAGAQFGTALLWTALVTWPLMSAVQMMCARIGMVTGTGLMTALRRKFPRPLLAGAANRSFGSPNAGPFGRGFANFETSTPPNSGPSTDTSLS